ncbi:MAG: alpha/beta fold hydrolase [Myxococcales bacterium]
MAWLESVSGHLWTLAPAVQARLRPAPVPPGERFEVAFVDSDVGDVNVNGVLNRGSDRAAPLVVIIHGLGGSVSSPYVGRLGRLASGQGASTLLLNLRGADRLGDDIYHAGLVTDIVHMLASPQLDEFKSIALLGCSLGGHIALTWSLAPTDERVRAVGALCSPVDLEQGCLDIDAPARAVYRDHLLGGLKIMYTRAHARGRLHTPLEQVLAARTMRAWDQLAVVPRFGFESVEAYWQATQMAPHLRRLTLPTRLVVAKSDPMVLATTSARHLTGLPAHVHVQQVAGGHLGFPPASSAETKLMAWLLRTARR